MSIKASVGLDLNDAINYMGQSMQVNLDNLSLDSKEFTLHSTIFVYDRKGHFKITPYIKFYRQQK